MLLLYLSDEEGELNAPPPKKAKTGSGPSINSGPEAAKDKSSKAPKPPAAAENALTRMLTKNKRTETSAPVITSSSAAAAASAEEHVSASNCFNLPLISFEYCFPQSSPRANVCLRAGKCWLSRRNDCHLLVFLICFAADPFHRPEGL